MKDIISCSRRTDIPALYYRWLQERLAEKKVTLVNHFSNEPYDIDLDPETVHSIVLWSKNYRNIIKDPGLLKEYNLFFQFTINGYSKELEPNIPYLDTILNQMDELAKKYSPRQISWRFDPILFCQYESWENRLKVFERISLEAARVGVCKCTFSFIDIYGKVKESLEAKKIDCVTISDRDKIEFTEEMLKIAKPLNISLYSCCEEVLEAVEGVNKSHCVDGNLLEELFGERATKARDHSQRLTCGCMKSKDIGSYKQRCSHKCVYCYANPASYTKE